MILAGDIGGTNTRLAIFSMQQGTLSMLRKKDFRNRNYSTVEALITEFLASSAEPLDLAALAVAGPVVENRVTGTNLPWTVDAAAIGTCAKLGKVMLLNDLLALAYGLDELQPSDIETLQIGRENSEGNCAVVAAGTGLGEAGLLRKNQRFTPFPSEGGHSDFAPKSEIEAEMVRYLRRKFGHVSYERVLSGQGTINVYEFLRDSGKEAEPPELAKELAAADDKASAISQHALAGTHPICFRTLDIFANVLAAEAGNVALRMFATGGVFIGGGIGPKIADYLRKPSFLQCFRNKGRMSPLMERIPLKLIANEHTGLIGAAAYGFEQTANTASAKV
ncbi:MAG: glucokinase [Acidobacteriaceae bacterium]